MARTIKVFFVLLLFSTLSSTATAQLYKTGVGARAGFFNGFTIKHFVEQDRAVEGILSTRWNGFIITGLYEFQREFPDIDNLEWFFGGGAHIGFWGKENYHWGDDNESHTIVGLDLILGTEYTFDEFPISISLDWKPAFNIFGDFHWWGDGIALSARYTFR